MNTRLNVLLRLQTPFAHLSDTVPRTKKACHSVCRTGWRMLSTDGSKASPWLLQGLEVRVRKASVGSGRWLRIKQLTLPPLQVCDVHGQLYICTPHPLVSLPESSPPPSLTPRLLPTP